MTKVTVLVKHEPDGRKLPMSILWEDGRTFDIEKVTDVRPCASLKSGGVGTRYTCVLRRKPIYLFEELDYWFVERP